jgi:hypothetical protein
MLVERSAQTMHLSWSEINNLQKDQSMLPLDPRHLEFPLGAPKTIFELITCSAQTMPLSYVKISSISKQIKMSFYLTQVT